MPLIAMMLWEWLAVLIAGVAGAGGIVACATLLKRPPLKRLAPAGAGLCMLLAVIIGEYLWAGHMKASLPAHAQIVQELRHPSIFKPWTWLMAPVQRISAIAPVSDDHSPIVLVELYLLARWQSPIKTRQWFDCAQPRRANSSLTLNASPPANPAAWTPLTSGDSYLRVACQDMRLLPQH